MPTYPVPQTTPFTGNLPSMAAMGPSDLLASSSTGPYYAALIDRQYGRHLAGADNLSVQDEKADQAWAKNELDLYQEMDDVQGSGIFDAAGTDPNIYPDAGVLADRYSVPGYLARERMFEKSEVVDSTTGRPVIYVNGGAVAMDSAQQIAFLERGLYSPPVPLTQAYHTGLLQKRSIVNVAVNTAPISTSGLGATPMSPTTKALLITGAVAFSAGLAWAVFGKKGRR